MMLPRASIFGGSWLNDDNAGSRYANLDNWPENSNDNLGVRGRSDDRQFPGKASRTPLPKAAVLVDALPLARVRSRPPRPATRAGKAAPDQGLWSARLSCFGEHVSRSGRAGRRKTLFGKASRTSSPSETALVVALPVFSRPAAGIFSRQLFTLFFMAKHYRNLIGAITAPANMERALRLTARGKRLSPGYLEFKEFGPLNLDDLAREMRTGRYVAGHPREFFIFDPKKRLISALPFRDRVAQQALCLVIGPIFDRALLPRAFASRPGMGTHAGVRLLQATLRRRSRQGQTTYVLKTDFSQYFASIQRDVLWRLIEAKITCRATRDLIAAMVPRTGIGLPIGNLTSQLFANVYTGATLDRHLQQTLGERDWFRYMDDLVVLGDNAAHLHALKGEIEAYARRELGLRFSKWHVAPAARGVNFLGYRIWADHKLLRRDSVTRARRRIAALRRGGDDERLRRFLAGWLGHARFADSHNLIRALGAMLEAAR